MTIARIVSLVVGASSEERDLAAAERAAIESAFSLGTTFKAEVRLLHVAVDPARAIPLLSEGMSGTMASRLSAELAAEAQRADAAVDQLYRELCLDRGLPLIEKGARPKPGVFAVVLEKSVGVEEEVLSARAKLADLVVLPHPTREEGGSSPTVEGVLFNSGRPVLLTPHQGLTSLPSRMAVAWNGSAEAARAVAQAMPLLKRAEEVVVISGESDEAPPEAQPSALAGYLAAHGLETATWRYQPDDWPVARSLVQEVRKSGAGLLVMGAYGHSRMRELLLGGATREALRASDLAIYMAH